MSSLRPSCRARRALAFAMAWMLAFASVAYAAARCPGASGCLPEHVAAAIQQSAASEPPPCAMTMLPAADAGLAGAPAYGLDAPPTDAAPLTVARPPASPLVAPHAPAPPVASALVRFARLRL